MTDAFTRGPLPDNGHQRAGRRAGCPRELLPDNIANKPTGAFLCFLFFVLQAA
jgi:hypothetical protein